MNSEMAYLACEQAHLIGKGGGAATDREQAKPARRMGRGKVSLHASY